MLVDRSGRVELHDAVLEKMTVDHGAATVRLDIRFYETEKHKQRIAAIIQFEGVESFSQVCDVERMRDNVSAGNINYWVPADGKGTT